MVGQHVRLSVVIAHDDAPATAFVVMRGFSESIAHAGELGYDGVELALRSADDVTPSQLDEALRRANVEVSALSTGQVFAVDGLSLTAPDSSVREATVRRFRELIALAADFGRKVNIGRVRGGLDITNPAASRDGFVRVIEELSTHASKHGVVLLLEPVNRYELNFLNSVRETADFIRTSQLSNTKIMADLFHMNIEDSNIQETLIQNLDLIGYVHVADSDRRFLGSGHLDVSGIIHALINGGYTGWFAAEVLPEPDSDTAAQRTVEQFRSILRSNKLGARL